MEQRASEKSGPSFPIYGSALIRPLKEGCNRGLFEIGFQEDMSSVGEQLRKFTGLCGLMFCC